MSIDWAKAEERPEKKLAIEGKFLLDLRSKVNNLEKQLESYRRKRNRTESKGREY